MSFNGSGTFVINSAGQPVVSGTVISSTAFNALTADLANGLSTCITKDGQTTPTADIPMGSNKITGLANGTAAGDAANLGQVQSTVAKLLGSVSGADTITAVGSPTVAAYAAGQMFYFVAAGANTGAVTINIDSLGAKSITRDGTTALAAGDIQSGEVCVIVYDGTQFQLVNGASQSASIVTENLTVNKATVLNESGGDNDTRIEGDTDANLFFVDASTDRIGVGTNSPSNKLTVSGNADITGNVGIGTASPATTLGIIGAGLADVNAIGTYQVTVDNNAAYNATPQGGILHRFKYNVAGDLTTGAAIRLYKPNANDNDASSQIGFLVRSGITAQVQALTLDASGNLGLGVTPSAWGSQFRAIEGANGGYSAYQTNATALYQGLNHFFDGTNFIYKTSNFASQYQQFNGQHIWLTAPSGTAGNTVTFTQALTLDASGNLALTKVALNSDSPFITGANISSGSNPLAVGTTGSSVLHFFTNNAERARITSGGYFKASDDGVYGGSASTFHEFNQSVAAQGVLTLYGDNASTTAAGMLFIETARNTTNNTYYAISYYNSGAAAYKFRVADSGDVTNTNGTYGTISDAKMKTDIVDAGSQWADMKAVRFRKFKMKDDPAGLVQLGVVAQELEQTSPGLVDEHTDRDAEGNDLGTTTKSVKTSVLLMKAAVALQEAMTRIEALEAKVAALEAK